MSLLSTSLLLCAGRGRDVAHPLPLGPVVDLGIGAELFEQAEAAGLGGPDVEVAELDGAGRARFHAGGHVIGRLEVAPALRGRAFLCRVPTAVTEVALLDYAAHAGSHGRIERPVHPDRPRRIPPVE